MGRKSRTKAGRAGRSTSLTTAAVSRIERPGGGLLVILALAAAARAAYLFFSTKSPFFEPLLLDPRYYDEWARRVAEGNFAEPSVFYGLPLYPFVLGAVYALTGGSLLAAKVLQAFLGLATLTLVYLTAERLSGGRRSAALAAAALGAVYGPLFFNESILIPEAFGVPLYAAAFYAAVRLWERPAPGWGALCGVLFGLAALTKAGVLIFAVIFAAALAVRLVRSSSGAAPAVLCALALLGTLAPVTAHNLLRGKDLVLLTSHAGFNFYIGNNPKAEGVFVAPEGTGTNVTSQIEDSKALAERALGRALKPSEVSRYWADRAMEFIRSDPGRALGLFGRKILLFFDAREISDVNDYAFERRFNPLLRVPWPDFGWLGPLVFMGFGALALGVVRQRALVTLWVAGYLAGLATFFVNGRYRLPLLGIFFVLAGIAVADAADGFRRRRWGAVALYAALAAAGAGVGHLNLVGQDPSKNLVNTGDVYLERKDYGTAIGYFDEALALKPDSPKAHLARGIALTGLERPAEAKASYLTALTAEPNAQAYNNLGMIYFGEGDATGAEQAFLKALELRPQSSQSYNNLGMIYGERGDLEKARGMFERSLELNPLSARACTNLGLVLYRLGQHERAAELWRRALEIDPSFEEARRVLRLAGLR